MRLDTRGLCALLIVLLVALSSARVLDDYVDDYTDEAITNAALTYATARGINALVSMLQSSEVEAGVGIAKRSPFPIGFESSGAKELSPVSSGSSRSASSGSLGESNGSWPTDRIAGPPQPARTPVNTALITNLSEDSRFIVSPIQNEECSITPSESGSWPL